MGDEYKGHPNSLWDHLSELRTRLLKSLIALAITVILSFYFGDHLVNLLLKPIGGVDKVQSIEVTENIGVFMRVSLLGGVIIAFPYILYQLLAFVLPGLTRKEKKWVMWSIPFATILFLSGVAFAYLVMLPVAVPFLVNFLGVTTLPRLSNYINFISGIVFWTGICFEMPLLVFVLARLRLVRGQMLLKQWRLAIVIIAFLAAVITPTVDPVNMAILMVPLLALYFLSVMLAFIAGRK